MAVICCPGCSQSASTKGSEDGVVVTIISAPMIANFGVLATLTSKPNSSCSSAAQSDVLFGSRAHRRTRLIGRTKVNALSCNLACVPAPRMAAVSEFCRAKYLAATAPAAAVRTSVK